MPKEVAGELSKRSRRDQKMLPLRAQRTAKASSGSEFLIVGNSPGQGCSCGILRRLQNGEYEILEEIIDALSNTAHLLASESGPNGFEFAVLELSSRGATLPAKKQRATTFAQFAKLLAGGRLPESTLFIVKAAA